MRPSIRSLARRGAGWFHQQGQPVDRHDPHWISGAERHRALGSPDLAADVNLSGHARSEWRADATRQPDERADTCHRALALRLERESSQEQQNARDGQRDRDDQSQGDD